MFYLRPFLWYFANFFINYHSHGQISLLFVDSTRKKEIQPSVVLVDERHFIYVLQRNGERAAHFEFLLMWFSMLDAIEEAAAILSDCERLKKSSSSRKRP